MTGYHAIGEPEHRGGVPWHEAPVPRRWHRCKVQTRGRLNQLVPVYRCACGAISTDAQRWAERNSRRRVPPHIRELRRELADLKAAAPKGVPRG